jgi:predicted transcriptional regulator of viral defense system
MSKSRASADFFATHPVFRREAYLAQRGSAGRSPFTGKNLLAKHVASGRLVRVRGGVYAVVPTGVAPLALQVDPYLTATQLTPDAVVAYHAALQFHGKAYSSWMRFHYLTHKRARPLTFRGLEFIPVLAPTRERKQRPDRRGVLALRHAGGLVRVTSLERTLVDVFSQPQNAGGWEEVWRSLELVEFFDLDAVLNLVKMNGAALTAARVGFFLEQHREALMVEPKHLAALERLAPKAARYLDATRTTGTLVSRWSLVVPERVLQRSWEETR